MDDEEDAQGCQLDDAAQRKRQQAEAEMRLKMEASVAAAAAIGNAVDIACLILYSEADVNPLGNRLHVDDLRQKHTAEAAGADHAQLIEAGELHAKAAAVAAEEQETSGLSAEHDAKKLAQVEVNML